MPPLVFQQLLDYVAAGRLTVPIFKVFDGLEHVADAHRLMKDNKATGKLVVRVRHE